MLFCTAEGLTNRFGQGYHNAKPQGVFKPGPYMIIGAFGADGRSERVEVRSFERIGDEVLAQLVKAEIGDAPASAGAPRWWVTPSGIRIGIADDHTRIQFAAPTKQAWLAKQ